MGELHSPYIAIRASKGRKRFARTMLVRRFVKGAKAIRPYVLVRYFVEGRMRFAHTIMPLFLWFAIKKHISLHQINGVRFCIKNFQRKEYYE